MLRESGFCISRVGSTVVALLWRTAPKLSPAGDRNSIAIM
jgi:hypothetical protein